jgi:hypothetical protein
MEAPAAAAEPEEEAPEAAPAALEEVEAVPVGEASGQSSEDGEEAATL